ncbi:HAD family hydrolase [Treponema brennaborense]|uniref:Uncharacterized protein n=1 Tax=Treponema brennaborense (strain DSM 12168 / CIP 105900 / DD5/3) TaxID=906968 RepID=F4LMV5_TREBD|nr:HAD family hydrolase [Treponema brennaborense]AEE17845.1 hypothetical protein Trebr_2438 [Treponema brennaborense DSM 12168]
MNTEYIRKSKETKPVVAICYDFDKTLSPNDMQAQGFIQSVGCDVTSFWTESNGLADANEMDQNLAYMYTMMKKVRGNLVFNKKVLKEYGAQVMLFPGVENWFDRIKEYGEAKGVIIEHYIISSGLKEMIEGTRVADKFEKIYASSFYYDEDGVALWPAQVINYTSKTQFLFRIEKGVLDVNDSGVNDYFEPEKIRVPFRNMIYIGDSDTDIPCMKLINSNQGHSIGVYNSETNNKSKVFKMMHDNRIKYFAPADYTENSELDKLIKAIIDRTAYNEVLESIHYKDKTEFIKNDESTNAEQKAKRDLIIALENSNSFAKTHVIVDALRGYNEWSAGELDWLVDIAVENSQVYAILTDSDVKNFYKSILEKMTPLSDKAYTLKSRIAD